MGRKKLAPKTNYTVRHEASVIKKAKRNNKNLYEDVKELISKSAELK